MDTHLLLQPKSLADHIGGFVEYLRKISSTFLLNQNGCNDDFQVLQRNTFSQIVHGCLQIKAIVLLVEANAKLGPNRIRSFTRSQIQSGDETVTRAQSAHHQIKCVRQTLLEFVEALFPFAEYIYQGTGTEQQPDQDRKDDRSGSKVDQIGGYHETEGGHKE